MEMLLYVFIYEAFKLAFNEIGLKAATQPIRTYLVDNFFNKWSGVDEERKKAYFVQTCSAAETLTIENYAGEDKARAELVLSLFNNNISNQQVLEKLGTDLNGILLSVEPISKEEIAEVYSKAIKFDHYIKYQKSLDNDFIIEVLAVFLRKLRLALEHPQDDPYWQMLTDETHQIVKDLHEDRPPDKPVNTEEEYKTQINRILGEIGFEGIASSGIRYPIPLTKIYVDLNAKPLNLKKASWSDEEGTLSLLPIEELGLSTKDFNSLKSQGVTTIQEIIDINYAGGLEKLKSIPGMDQSRAEKLLSILEKDNFIPSSFQDKKPKKCIDLLGLGNRILLLGDPGSGKTTYLKYCAVETARGNAEINLGMPENQKGPWFPIYVELREFSKEITERNEDYSLLDFINTYIYEQFESRLPDNHVHKALIDKRCIVCLDGLDEVWNVSNRRKINNAVLGFTNKYEGNCFLITSRFRGYETAPLNPGQCAHYKIEPFGPDEINLFVSFWYQLQNLNKQTEQNRIKNLLDTFKENNKIQDLARNPLLLTIIALVHKDEAELPDQRHKLYEKCVETLLDTWDKPKEIPAEEKKRVFYQERRPILEKLAYDLHTSPHQELMLTPIKRADLEQTITDFLIDHPCYEYKDNPAAARVEAKEFINFIPKRTGLLLERGVDEFSFSHLTFQEYLTAIHIQNSTSSSGIEAVWEEIELRLHKPHWEEVLLLLLGRIGDLNQGRNSTYLVNKILNKGNIDRFEPVLHHHLFFAGRILADGVIVSAQLSKEIISILFNILWNSPKWIADDIANVLVQLDSYPVVIQTLLNVALDNDDDEDIRIRSLSTLGMMDSLNDEVIHALIDIALDKDGNKNIREWSAIALRMMDLTHQQVIQTLLGLARDIDEEEDNRYRAIVVLGGLSSPAQQVIQTLLNLVRDKDENHLIRLEAKNVLSSLNHPNKLGSYPLIVQSFLDLARDKDEDEDMRRWSLRALWSLAPPDQQVIQPILDLVFDKNEKKIIRTRALEVLTAMDSLSEHVAQALLDLARERDEDEDIRLSTLEVLGIKGTRYQWVVQSLLDFARDKDDDQNIRFQAIEVLEWVEHPDQMMVQTLIDFARDKNEDLDIRELSTITLVRTGAPDQQVVQTFLDLARDKDEDKYIRSGVVKKMQGMASLNDQVVHTLLGFVQDKDLIVSIRSWATISLIEMGSPSNQVIHHLLDIAKDKNMEKRIRSRAVYALRKLDAPDQLVIKTLLDFARERDEDVNIRSMAVEVLGLIGSPDEHVAQALLGLALERDEDTSVQQEAYNSLIRLLGIPK